MRALDVIILVVMVGLLSPEANATAITFDLDVEFSGAQSPMGQVPWLRAVIDDGGGTGSVTLTLIALNLVGSEFVTGWYFNVNPVYGSLAVAHVGGVAGSASYSQNAYKADGDGKYDLLFSFDSNAFTAGESSVWTISAAGLKAVDFDLLSQPAGGHGPFRTAAHVQGIGTDGQGSGWITESGEIPEPGTVALVIAGILGLGARRSRLF